MNTITAGSKLGPYVVVSRIGAGGMGEVWHARDTRLDRSVAVKVLPAEFSGDAQLQARLEREARTISQLNHPNICTLHDIGSDGGISYLVMELLEGESLSDRVARGPLPVADVLRFGAQIAGALDRAHRAGIVHRDLKPANVMITKSGAKLLDFGLAKGKVSVLSTPLDGETLVRASGRDEPLTAEGTIVGTFQYMAPEQLEGRDADARTDIFALGAVLYEMATGRRAFDGKTKTSLIAAIVGGQPEPILTLQPLTPPALEHIVARALEKDPDDRWQSAHDVAEELRWVSEAGSQAGVPVGAATGRRRRQALSATAAVVLAVIAAVLGTLYVSARQRADRVLVLDFTASPGWTMNNVGDDSGPPVLSPDGKSVVFSAASTDGVTQLWVRKISTGETRMLPGSRAATFPFWSYDGKNVGFFADGFLKRADLTGGAPLILATVNAGRGGTWSKDDVIVYTSTGLGALSRMPASGGKATALTKLDASRHTTHRWPWFLPDGKHVLFLAANHQDVSGSTNGIYIVNVDGSGQHLVLPNTGNATFSDGRLLFVRDTTLYAQSMTADGKLSGDPAVVVDGVLNDRGIWRGGFSAADSGDLLYCAGQTTLSSRVVWVDRSGKELGTVGEGDMFWDVALSPDQKRLAIGIGDPSRQLWLMDLARNTRTHIELGARWSGVPTWSPDGSTLVAQAIRQSGFGVVSKRLDGSVAREVSRETSIGRTSTGSTFSPDGKTVIYASDQSLWRRSLDGAGAAARVLPESIKAYDPRLSPDGKWLAYVSTENGRADVFVALARDVSQRWQLSDAGGMQPIWRSDGREIFYVDGSSLLTAAQVSSSGDSLEIGPSQKLFTVRTRILGRTYDVARDGQRFIVNRVPEASGVGVKVVTNWQKLERER